MGRSQQGFPLWPIFLILAIVLGIPLLVLLVCGIGMAFTTFMAHKAVEHVHDEVVNARPPVIVIDPPRPNPFPPAPPKPGPLPNPVFDPNGLVPDAPPQPPAPAGVPGKTMIDLIPLINTEADRIHGRWMVHNNVLHCNEGGLVPRIKIPYQPPREYDFVVTFSQPTLRNGISLIMPNPNGGNSFFWFLGSEHGKLYGFHANPNIQGQVDGLIKPKTVTTTVVQVRANTVKGFVNGKQMIGHATNFQDLLCDGWRDIRDKSVLAVACDDPTVFHHVRLIEISGKGTKTR